ncbi:MAG TPA: glycoside hydrolase family 30 protein [Candidatus Acidoferrales bacterium]|nr:glycoside hydrolase family 30 protein [Candidatus Acidoferrales bacterium]
MNVFSAVFSFMFRCLLTYNALSVLMGVHSYGQQKQHEMGEVFVTAKSTNQFLADEGSRALEPVEQPDENYPTVMIDETKTFQTIEGFGGAFTDAAALVFARLPKESQEKFVRACFDPDSGNAYNLCRTTINSCDYSDEMYTYDDVKGDGNLEHFTIAHELKYRIPLIKEAMKIARGSLRLFASPWSPPAWMKTNDNMLYGGKLKSEYYQTWADYFVKYIKEYQKEGIPIWGVTVQNEPMAVQVWESCIYTAEEEKDFVRDNLGPAFDNNGLGNVKIMVWDHNRGIMYQRSQAAYEDPKASRYIWGTAFHWYVGGHFDNVRVVHDAFPDKQILFTEASVGGSWHDAYKLAENVINDLNNWAVGWVTWNLLLDQDGGPRHAGGLEGANIVTADLLTGDVIFNPAYYVFGHFSRFIKPGAKRIACTSNDDNLKATAFINTDGKIVTVIYNQNDCAEMFQLWVSGKVLKGRIPPNGVVSIIL